MTSTTAIAEDDKVGETGESTEPETAAEETATVTDGSPAAEDSGATAVGGRRHPRVPTALRGPRARRWSVGALAAVAVAALALCGWLGREWKVAHDTDQAAAAAQSVARDYAVTLTSVSADSIDDDFRAVLNGATGEFKSMYTKSSGQLRQLLVDNKAQAQGKVIASGVTSATPGEVKVVLFIDQSVRNASTPEPRIDRSRVSMTMTKIDGRWLASEVELP